MDVPQVEAPVSQGSRTGWIGSYIIGGLLSGGLEAAKHHQRSSTLRDQDRRQARGLSGIGSCRCDAWPITQHRQLSGVSSDILLVALLRILVGE